MTINELRALIDGYHGEDEVIFLSPGGKVEIPTGLNTEYTNKTSRVTIGTDWEK